MGQTGGLLENCYKRWYHSLASMPIYGEAIDQEVLKYVEGCRDLALGNVNWRYVHSFIDFQGTRSYNFIVLNSLLVTSRVVILELTGLKCGKHVWWF